MGKKYRDTNIANISRNFVSTLDKNVLYSMKIKNALRVVITFVVQMPIKQ
jgi:hypothetical protein